MEIRAFMPKYGIVNERRNQLHEVIRLSGMNIVVSDVDRPLVIKVASVASVRMQVYFIQMRRGTSLMITMREPYSLPEAHWRL